MVRKARFQYQRQSFQQVLALALLMGCALRPHRGCKSAQIRFFIQARVFLAL